MIQWPDNFQHVVQVVLLAFCAVSLGLVVARGADLPARFRRSVMVAMVGVVVMASPRMRGAS